SGGHIQVHSALGLGTRFEIFFPLDNTPRSEETRKQEVEYAGPAPHATVLLADDESALRHAVAEMLRQSGYTVLDANTAPEAVDLAKFHRGEIDLLLTDIAMPGLRGTDLAAAVRGFRPDIKVIYMSGYAEGISENQTPDEAQYLQKPFRLATLLNALRTS